jgi:hypothetical protein
MMKKNAIKDTVMSKVKDVKSATLNVMHKILAELAKAGNALAKKLLKKLAFDPKMAEPVYKLATK